MERSCGSCSLCCKLLSIEGVEDRPGWTWCKHCRPGKGGCSIYDDRPHACRSFVCGWLSGALDSVLDSAPPKKATRKKPTAKALAGKRMAATKVAGRKKPPAARSSRVAAAAKSGRKATTRGKTTLRKSKSRRG